MESPTNPNAETEEKGPQEPEDSNLDRPAPAGGCGDLLPTEENVWKHFFKIVCINFHCLDE